jgi:hypothetical protein
MPLNQTSLANVVAKMSISNADKRALTTIVGGLTDDIEQLRAQNAALLTKLDTANLAGVGNNNVATIGLAKTSMNVKKS